jgi:hypothetical protein
MDASKFITVAEDIEWLGTGGAPIQIGRVQCSLLLQWAHWPNLEHVRAAATARRRFPPVCLESRAFRFGTLNGPRISDGET